VVGVLVVDCLHQWWGWGQVVGGVASVIGAVNVTCIIGIFYFSIFSIWLLLRATFFFPLASFLKKIYSTMYTLRETAIENTSPIKTVTAIGAINITSFHSV
jgi:hypothetical protein